MTAAVKQRAMEPLTDVPVELRPQLHLQRCPPRLGKFHFPASLSITCYPHVLPVYDTFNTCSVGPKTSEITSANQRLCESEITIRMKS